jgi:hypothetical protein
MADIVITPASVVPGANAIIEHGWAGATILAGQVVYRADSTDGKYRLADNNVPTPVEVHTPRGIALHGASANQPLTIIKSGTVTMGATLVANTAYYLSDTPGGICLVADLTVPIATGEQPVMLGFSASTTVLNVDIQSAAGPL